MKMHDRDWALSKGVDRRTFIKISGAVGVVAVAGALEGILSTHTVSGLVDSIKG
jgi:hypothetical protein